MSQRMIHISSPVFLREPDALATGLSGCFPHPERALALEIGCGTGDFLVEIARRNPETNYLGIDIFNKGCKKTCSKVTEAGLENVRVMRSEARFLLTRLAAAGSLSTVYINCPDPWPKKRHRYRRLVNLDFLNLLSYVLQPEGELFFVTDFDDYAGQIGTLVPTLSAYQNCLPEPISNELGDYPISKYMRRFLDLGQPLFLCHLRRRIDAEVSLPPRPVVQRGFRLRWGRQEHG